MFESMQACPDCECEMAEAWSGDLVCVECHQTWENTDGDGDDGGDVDESYDAMADEDGGG